MVLPNWGFVVIFSCSVTFVSLKDLQFLNFVIYIIYFFWSVVFSRIYVFDTRLVFMFVFWYGHTKNWNLKSHIFTNLVFWYFQLLKFYVATVPKSILLNKKIKCMLLYYIKFLLNLIYSKFCSLTFSNNSTKY